VERHCAEVLTATGERVQEALNVLWEGRGLDQTSMIYIDQPLEMMQLKRPVPKLRRDAEVRILDPGRIMRGVLSSSCEYLFWNALDHNDGWKYLPQDVSVEEAVRSERAVIITAVSFFEGWVARRLSQYREFLATQSHSQAAVYSRAYSEAAFEGAIRASVGTFVQESRELSRSEIAELHRRLGRGVGRTRAAR
jgi:hypothetical protein